MAGDGLYKQAISDVKNLVEYVINECDDFADKYDYDKEWFKDRFREEFNKRKRNMD